jgi:hypothetical protein
MAKERIERYKVERFEHLRQKRNAATNPDAGSFELL